MLSTIISRLAGDTSNTKKMLDELIELRAIKAEINKARSVIEFDTSGRILSSNDNVQKTLGYDQSELLNQHHRILLASADAASAGYQNFWQELAAGKTQAGDFKLQNKAGSTVWFQGYYAPIMDAQGQIKKVDAFLTDITASKARSLALQGEDEAIHQSFGVMECDMNANILDCNDLFLKPIGYTREEVIGKNVAMFLDPAISQSAEYKKMWEKLNRGESESRQIKRNAKDGKEYWFQSTYVPIKGEQNKPYKVVVYSYCITAEKLRIADIEGQLKALSKIQGIVEYDLKGNTLSVNEIFAKVSGYADSEIIGSHHSMFVESSYKSSNEYKAFWDKLVKGEPNEGVYKRIGKGGKEIWLQASYNPIFDMNGKPFKVVEFAIDITDYRLKDADNAGQLEAINKIQGVIQFDLTGKILAVNENFANVTGYSEKEIVGNHHSMFVDPAYRASPEYKAFWDKLGRGEAEAGQYKRVGKGDREVWLQASYNPILDMNGKPFKVVKYATDITEQINASHALTKVVEESQEIIGLAQSGDLTQRLSLEGKTGAVSSMCDGINTLLDKMAEVVMQVKEAGETINTAAGEIATGNNDLSSRTEQQASSLEETASSMEELASTVKQNAENAKQANQLAAAASGVAVKGGAVVGEVVTTMADINSSSRKIEDIISVIDGIAFQTNILALNAAVEAARAGEQGRGFAVVAGEVRNLAQRSAAAAKEIKQLISDSVSKVQNGTKLVEDAGKTMEEIVSSVQRVTDIMGEISAASSEQSAGIDQVNNAITSMDEVTQQNAALVEEAAAAAESLVEQAASLMDTVNSFKLSSANRNDRRATGSQMRANSAPAQSRSAAKTETKQVTAKVLARTGTEDGDWEEF